MNRLAFSSFALIALLVVSSSRAHAETSPAPGANTAGSADTVAAAPPHKSAPPPARGFQAAFRSGVLLPTGSATAAPGDSLGSRYAWQLPLAVDLGVKVMDPLFLGGYLGIGFGSTGSDSALEAACDDDDEDLENDIVCSTVTLRAGLEAQYGFQPGERLNPWIGYGLGVEAAYATLTDNERGYSETVSMSGFTYAQLSAGLDLRNPIVGAGPFIEGAIGQFTSSSTDMDGKPAFSGTVDDRALHAWLFLGLRVVVNP